MRYFDTSFLTPLILEERTSSRIARFMGGLPAGELATSRWTEVEFASLLARDVRMGALHGDEAREADAVFEDVIRQSFVVLLPDAGDFALARRYLHNYGTGLSRRCSAPRNRRELAGRRHLQPGPIDDQS